MFALSGKTFDDILHNTSCNQYSNGKLQDLVEAEAGPQSQVGPEEVQAVHEAELVHRGLLHSHVRVKVETQQSCGVFSCRHLPLNCGGGPQTRQQTRRLQNAIEQVH